MHWTLGKFPENIKSLVFDSIQTIQIFPFSPFMCWRCNTHTGNLIHTLWDCKALFSFWKASSSFIVSLTGNLTALTPAMALLGLNLDLYTLNYRTIVANILIAARLTITKLWKSTLAPNLSEVILRLNSQAGFTLLPHVAHSRDPVHPRSLFQVQFSPEFLGLELSDF